MYLERGGKEYNATLSVVQSFGTVHGFGRDYEEVQLTERQLRWLASVDAEVEAFLYPEAK